MELSPPQEKDVELMRVFIWAGYQKLELIALNQCRLYLQVIYLLDICNALGTKIKQYLWTQPQMLTAGTSGQ